MYRRALKTFAAAALITTIMGTSVFADDLDTLKTQQQEAQQQVDNLTQQLAYLLTEIESLEQDMADLIRLTQNLMKLREYSRSSLKTQS